MRSTFGALGCALALVAAPAIAQVQPAKAAPVAAPDPARLAVAQELADKLVQPGMYQRMLGENFNRMMDAMLGSAAQIPLRDVAQMGGMTEKEVSQLGDTTLREVMEVYDPNWQERQRRMVRGMMGELGKVLSAFEPRIRTAIGRAYAREYSLAELQELKRFFATPAGDHYARTAMDLMMGPEMSQAAAEAVPEMMKQMPAVVQAAQAAAKDLPPPRKPADLTSAEREKILKLLGSKATQPAKK